jgi:predicted DNA-binding protein (UPF0251 family)
MEKLLKAAEESGMTLRDYLIEEISNYSSKREAAKAMQVSRSTLDIALARCGLHVQIRAVTVDETTAYE